MSAALFVLCTVLTVTDGDSMQVQCKERKKPIAVRLAEIDAPELTHAGFGIKGQPFGAESRDSLRAICLKKPAVVHRIAIDRYGRTVAKVECAGVSANEYQVRQGMAWAYQGELLRGSHMPALEADALKARRGLWSAPPAVAPWIWRKKS